MIFPAVRRGRRAAGRRHSRAAAPAAALARALATALAAVAVTGCLGERPVSHDTPAGPVASAPARHGPCTVSALLVPSCGAWWGMYLDTDPGGTGLAAAVSAQQRLLGRRLDIIERYHDFSHGGNGIFPNPAEVRLAAHHLLLFSWAPAVWSSHTYYRWAAIAAGALDRTVLVPEARRLAALHHTVFLTFSAEPDGAVPGNGPAAEFVAAWRHVHDVFARQRVHNVVWVWTTTGYVPHAGTIASLYPGDGYADWIGYDPYNFFNCHHGPWHSFAQTVGPFYRWLTSHRLGAGKPLMLPEFGSAPDPAHPGREAAWFRGIVPVLRGLPRLKALILWNSATPGCNLKITADPAAASAYRLTGLSPYLRQALP